MKKTITLMVAVAVMCLMGGCGQSADSAKFDQMVQAYESATKQAQTATSIDEVSAIASDVKNELELLMSEETPSASQEKKLHELDEQFVQACEKRVEQLQSVVDSDHADAPDDGAELLED